MLKDRQAVDAREFAISVDDLASHKNGLNRAGLGAPQENVDQWKARVLVGECHHVPVQKDEIGELARALGDIHLRGVEAMRIRMALDSSSAMMMLADNDCDVVPR